MLAFRWLSVGWVSKGSAASIWNDSFLKISNVSLTLSFLHLPVYYVAFLCLSNIAK